MEFDEGRFAIGVDEPERMDPEPFHHPERARDGSIGHDPQDHVHAFRQERDEIPERVMRRGVLGIAAVGLHFHRMDEIGKLDCVLDEEDRNVVANEVEIALVRVKFDCKAAHIARHIPCARAAGDSREPREDFRFLAFLGEERRSRQMRNRIGHLEIAMSARSTGVHDALRNSLMIKMRNLLAKSEILEKRGSSLPGFQRILVVRNDDALIGRERPLRGVSGLMRCASRSGDKIFLRIFQVLRLTCFAVFTIGSAPDNQLALSRNADISDSCRIRLSSTIWLSAGLMKPSAACIRLRRGESGSFYPGRKRLYEIICFSVSNRFMRGSDRMREEQWWEGLGAFSKKDSLSWSRPLSPHSFL